MWRHVTSEARVSFPLRMCLRITTVIRNYVVEFNINNDNYNNYKAVRLLRELHWRHVQFSAVSGGQVDFIVAQQK